MSNTDSPFGFTTDLVPVQRHHADRAWVSFTGLTFKDADVIPARVLAPGEVAVAAADLNALLQHAWKDERIDLRPGGWPECDRLRAALAEQQPPDPADADVCGMRTQHNGKWMVCTRRLRGHLGRPHEWQPESPEPAADEAAMHIDPEPPGVTLGRWTPEQQRVLDNDAPEPAEREVSPEQASAIADMIKAAEDRAVQRGQERLDIVQRKVMRHTSGALQEATDYTDRRVAEAVAQIVAALDNTGLIGTADRLAQNGGNDD